MKLSVFYAAAVSFVAVVGADSLQSECSSPGPQDTADWQSFAYRYYPGMMIDNRCEKLEWYRSKTPGGCLKKCGSTEKCNAFHYKINHGGCSLMACPYAIPQPYQKDNRYDAYIAPGFTWSRACYDRFVHIDLKMSWPDAQAFCHNLTLDLYQPRNLMAVAGYLYDIYGDGDHSAPAWIGGKGNGTNQVFLSGNVITQDDPSWHPMDTEDFPSIGTEDKCLYLDYRTPKWSEKGKVLRAMNCNAVTKFICG